MSIKPKIRTIENNPKLLDMLINDQRKQQGHYRPGPYWESYCHRIVQAIKKCGLESFRSNPRIGKGFADCELLDPANLLAGSTFKSKIYSLIVNNYFFHDILLRPYREIIKSISNQRNIYMNKYYNLMLGEWYKDFKKINNLPNSCLENPTAVIDLCGDRIGSSYLNSYIRVYNYSYNVDFKIKNSLLEIGGGFGSNVHALINIYPNIKKVVFLDIPPILYIATQYLKSIYKDAVVDYSDTRNTDYISFKKDNSLEIICIAPWQIEKLDLNIDLFWNSASFQEMSEVAVKNYCKNFKRIMNDKTSICSYILKGHNKHTIESEKLINMISETLSKPFHEVEQRIEINIGMEGKYFLL